MAEQAPNGATAPRVGVVVPTRDTPRPMLARALRSVLQQTVADLELIVVDDGSRAPFSGLDTRLDDPRLRWMPLSRSGGPAAARNHGIHAARAHWIAFLDADDWWRPDKLALQLDALAARPDARWSYCGIWEHATAGLGRLRLPDPDVDGDVHEQMLRGQRITGSASSVLAERSLLVAEQGFETGLHISEDWDLWIRLAQQAPVVAVHEAAVHLSSGAFSGASRSGQLEGAERRRDAIIDRHRQAYAARGIEAEMGRRNWSTSVRRALIRRQPGRALRLLLRPPPGQRPPLRLLVLTLLCLPAPGLLRSWRRRELVAVPDDALCDAVRIRVCVPWRGDLDAANTVKHDHVLALAEAHALVLVVRRDARVSAAISAAAWEIRRVGGRAHGPGRVRYLLEAWYQCRQAYRERSVDALLVLIGEELVGALIAFSQPSMATLLDVYDLPAATVVQRGGWTRWRRVYAWLTRRLARRADGLLVGIRLEALAELGVPAERCRHLIGGVQLPAYRQLDAPAPWPLTPGGVKLVYVGAVHRARGALQMLDVVQALRASGRAVSLRIIGPSVADEARRTRERVAQQGLGQVVTVEPAVAPEQIPALLAGADIGLCPLQDIPQYRPTYPVKVREYMAAGLAMVLPDLPGIRELVGVPAAAELYTPDDLEAFTAALARLVDDPGRRAELGARGRSRSLDFDAVDRRHRFAAQFAELVGSSARWQARHASA